MTLDKFLTQAVYDGDIENAKLALLDGANINHREINDFRTVLFFPAMYGDLKMVKFLVKHNINVNATDDKGNNALHSALKNGNTVCVQFLIDSGIDPYQPNHLGDTALHICAQNNLLDAAMLLIDHSPGLLSVKNKCLLTPASLPATNNETQQLLKNYPVRKKEQQKLDALINNTHSQSSLSF